MKWPWVLFLLAILLGLAQGLFIGPVYPHGTAEWIMQGPHSYCCGPEDCHPIKVRVVPNGWAFDHPLTGKVITVNFDYPTKPSEDHQFWACFNLIAEDKPLRQGCFFLPEAQG